jgi:hypothetical protein
MAPPKPFTAHTKAILDVEGEFTVEGTGWPGTLCWLFALEFIACWPTFRAQTALQAGTASFRFVDAEQVGDALTVRYGCFDGGDRWLSAINARTGEA